jgi:protein TonB
LVDPTACTKPDYPRLSLRTQEEGTVTLAFLIDGNGRVQESRVERSSGHSRLDEAARRALSLCQFRPATVDGRPEASWARLQYVWRIEAP